MCAQLTGSGPGNGMNYANVDTSLGTNVGRLYTNTILDGTKVRGSGLVMFPKQEDRLINEKLFMIGSYVQPPGIPMDGSGGILVCIGSIDLHFTYQTRTDGNCIFEFHENVNVTNSGTMMGVFNKNRQSTNTINSAIWENPTVTNSGTIIYSAMMIGGSGSDTKFVTAPVSTANIGGDILLNNGSCYWIKYRNISGRNMLADFDAEMHEHN